jgi:hypothetical protein
MREFFKTKRFVMAGYAAIFLFAVLLTFVLIQTVHYQKSVIPREQRLEENVDLRAQREEEWKQRHKHFHTVIEDRLLATEKESTCIACHGVLPHLDSKKIRALRNMHTEYLACESCHLRMESRKGVIFKWYSPDPVEAGNPRYGTAYDENGLLIEPEKHAKIVPFVENAPFLVSGNIEKAREDLKKAAGLPPREKKEFLSTYHNMIEVKATECKDCHSTKGYLNFRAIGFSEKRVRELTYLDIVGMLDHYVIFHLPGLFSAEPAGNKNGGK